MIQDEDRKLENEIDADIPEVAKLKAHLKRRVERYTKNKWIQYVTEYTSEIMTSGTKEKETVRRYLDMTKEAVLDMNRKTSVKKKQSKERKRMRNIPFNEKTY